MKGLIVTLTDFVRMEDDRPVAASDKIAGDALAGRTSASLADAPVPLSSLPSPLMTLDRTAVEWNIASMQGWCDDHGMLLAPHGKTTMAPRLWQAQLAAGAWGITVANESQLRTAVDSGVPRVHLANTLLSAEGLRWLVAAHAADRELVTQFWIDSVQSVRVIEQALSRVHDAQPLSVLVEVGVAGGRTGARTLEEATAVAFAVAESRHLNLVGVAGYEGAVHSEDGRLGAVDRYLGELARTHRAIARFYAGDEVFLTAGGSAYFDRVAAVLGEAADDPDAPARVLVRSGAYVAHDDGLYSRITPAVRGAGPAFVAAMHAWARVLSMPEPGTAILDVGRRDVPFDQGMPVPQQRRRFSTESRLGHAVALEGTITELNDQHAFLNHDAGADLRVGDIVRLGISHPCTAFDKWRTLPVIDDPDADDPVVRELVTTYF